MPSRSRLLAPLVLLATAALLVAAAVWQPRDEPPTARPDIVPSGVPLQAEVPRIDALAADRLDLEKVRTNHAVRSAEDRTRPFLDDPGRGALTAVLPAGDHTLRSLRRALPSALRERAGHMELVKPLVVAPGATLRISRTDLRLRSTPSVQASIVAVRARLLIRRTTIRSRMPEGGPDKELADGRAYLQVQAGRMTLRRTTVRYLGHTTGLTSGVAWMHRLGQPATGGAWRSTFAHNLFGVYSSGASGLRFDRARFVRNLVYGFDPHGPPPATATDEALGTNDSLVTRSVAAHNGRHGFIFSSGCHRNEIRDSHARYNGGSGFVIDDGRRRLGLVNPSNDNILRRVTSSHNGAVGIVIEGGLNNVIDGAVVQDNRFGVRITGRSRSTSLRNLDIMRTSEVGLQVDDLSNADVTDSVIEASTVGVALDGGSSLHDVTVADAAITGLRMRPTDRLERVRVTGRGARAVDGIHEVDTTQWRTTEEPADTSVAVLSSTRHQVWTFLLLGPVVLWLLFKIGPWLANLTRSRS